MKYILVTLLIVAGSCQIYGQGAKYGFEMKAPNGWILTNKAELSSNLNKFEFTEEGLQTLLKQESGSTVLVAYMKYDPKTYVGLIPTIQVRVRAKGQATFEVFRSSILKSLEASKQVLEEYEMVGLPRDIEIAGIRSLLITSRFIMRGKKGQILRVRSRTYAIPRDKYFFQINFTDGFESVDCTEEFNRLVETIRIQ